MFSLADFGLLGAATRWGAAPTGVYEQAQLYMDFQNNAARLNGVWSSAVPLLTTTRASVAQGDTSDGWWGQFAANTPRWSDKGLLVEEARTNSIRNNTMVGGAGGTPGTPPTNWLGLGPQLGLTQTLAYGNVNGIDGVYIRFAGTTVGGTILMQFDGQTSIPALTGQTWTSSFFWQLTAGAVPAGFDFRNVIREYTSAGVIVLQSAPGALTGIPTALSRLVYTVPLSGGATTANVTNALRIAFGASIVTDFTVFVGWPQLEQGAFVTSPIKTSTVAVTRAADVIDVTSFVPTNPATLFGEVIFPALQPALFPSPIQIHGATADSNRMGLMYSGTTLFPSIDCTVGGVNQAALNFGSIGANVVGKTAAAFAVNDFAGSAQGAVALTDAAGSVVTPTKIAIGRSLATTHFANGYVRRVAYWNSRLGNAQLQAITA